MADYISVGVNFALAVIGVVVGVYFLSRAFKFRKVLDKLTLNMFFSIGAGAIVAAGIRAYYIPFYLGRAIGSDAIQRAMADLSWFMALLLGLSAWTFILHLKPLFYWVSFAYWIVVTLSIVVILTVIGTVGAQYLGAVIN